MTQPDADDPLKEQYGDVRMVQSYEQSGRTWTNAEDLSAALNGEQVQGRREMGSVHLG